MGEWILTIISTDTIRAYLFPHRSQIAVWVCFTIAMQHAIRPIMFSTLVLVLVPSVVTVRCEEKWYRVEEEAGHVTPLASHLGCSFCSL